MTTASPAAAKYLWDARRAGNKIVRFIACRTFGDYLTDDMMRAAVERQFEIVGEAFAGPRRADPALAALIPDLARISTFRNVLIHGHATVDDQLVWGVVERDLPRVMATLQGMLAEAER